jgi:hypothetical protein
MLKEWCSEAACRPKESMGKGYPKDNHKSFAKWPEEGIKVGWDWKQIVVALIVVAPVA